MTKLAPFPVHATLTAIAIAYRNEKLIADGVLPRITVDQKFAYLKYKLAEAFAVPDTRVGRNSEPNTVKMSAEEVESSVKPEGLQDFLPQTDIDNAQKLGINLPQRRIESLMDLVLLAREVRVAQTVTALVTYPAANRLTLAGSDQWNEPLSDPITDIKNALDSLIYRPNAMAIGRKSYSVLSSHPKIIKGTNHNSGDSGIATRQAIADLFELDEILVGDAFVNVASPGQAANIVRAWGNDCALFYRDKMATEKDRVTFGFTGQYGTRIANTKPVEKKGLTGGLDVWTGEFVREVIAASDLGFLIKSCTR
jgi:hypothetical protein